jgi:hypothetical protein
MRILLVGFGWALGFVTFLFIILMVPGISHLGEQLLGPGVALAVWYWPVQDPLQLVLDFILDVLFYGVVFCVALSVWKKMRPSRR